MAHSGTFPTQWDDSVRHRVLGKFLYEICTGSAGTLEPFQRLLGNITVEHELQ